MKSPQILSRFFRSGRPSTQQSLKRWRPARRLLLEPLEDRRVLTTFVVTNTLDGGPGSLRSAMIDANNTPNVGGPDRIEFNIPGSGIHIIQPTTPSGQISALPVIHDPVIIDGYTQPGASPNTLAVGDNAVLKIEIDGSLISAAGPRLFVIGGSGSGSTVRGLAITHVPDACFQFSEFGADAANNNTIAGNFIGTDAEGLTYQGGAEGRGIRIIRGHNNVIGGTAPTDRNVITATSSGGEAMINMAIGVGGGNKIQGNYIGVNKDGTAPLQPPGGGTLAIAVGGQVDRATIGGTTPGAGNVIYGTNTCIKVTEGGIDQTFIQGNLLGTNATGTAGLAAGIYGIDIQSANDMITGNVISGFSTGISLNPQSTPGPGPTIQGNRIGTDVTGTLPIPNSGDGILVLSSSGGATIGGPNPGDGNTIAFNGRYGVLVSAGQKVSILGNSIFANGNLGINLVGAPDGFTGPVTPNDSGDGDTGPNGVQNYPVLSFAGPSGSHSVVGGTLNSTPGTAFRIEFFANDVADPSGNGEGQTFLGAITTAQTDASGNVSFTAKLPGALGVGQIVSATASDPAGNTSEFSYDVTATNLDVVIDASTPQSFLDSLTVIHGSLIMVGVAGRTDLILPNLTEVDGDIKICDNPDLTTLSVPVLTTVGGDVEICDNPALTAVNLGSVTSVGGGVSVNSNTAATGVDLSSLTTVGGGVNVSGNTSATGVDLGSLNTVGGGVSVTGNTAATGVDLSSLATVGGTLSVRGNTSATGVDLGSLTTVGGTLSVSGNTAATGVDLGSLTSVSGGVSVSGNTAATGVDLSSLATVGGDMSVSDNSSMTSLSMGSAHGVGGSVTISDNDSLPSLLLPSLIDVGGDFNLTGNPLLTMFAVPQLGSIGGDTEVSQNQSMMTVDLSAFTSAGGSVSVNGNTSATSIDLGSLADVGGSVSVNGNTAATSIDLGGLANASGSVSVNGNTSATSIGLGSLADVGGSVSVNGNTAASSIDLGSLANASGSVSVNGNTAASSINLGSLANASGSVSVNGNTAASSIDLGSLADVGGDASVSGNTSMTSLSMGSAHGVGGSVTISDNDSLPSLLLPSLIDVGGDFIVTTNPLLTMFDVPQLGSVGGDTDVSENQSMMTVDLSSFTNSGGDVNINGNTAADVIDLASLTSLGGSVSISNNTGANVIDLSSLSSVGGSVSISDDAGANVIDLNTLAEVGGSVNISSDTGADVIDLSTLTSVGGSVSINDNTAASVIDLNTLTSVGGSVSINDNTGANVIDLSSLSSVGGDETLEAQDSITAVTADGSTEVTLFSTEAQMTAALADGTFADAVAFTVTRLDPAALPPEPGLDSSGGTATIDPLAAYQFDFAIPTLGQDASLTFEINVGALSAVDRDAFLTALAAGNATVAVKNDAPDSVYQAFAICDVPMDDASGSPCVVITRLDADGNPLAAGSTATPAVVRFEGVTGHFSDFAVVIVSSDTTAPVTPAVTVTAADAAYTGSAYDTANLATTVTPAASGSVAYVFYADAAGQNAIAAPIDAGAYYVQAFFTSSSTGFTNAHSGIVSFNITAKSLSVDATTQGTINIAKAGTISFALQITDGLVASNGDVLALFNGAAFTIAVGGTSFTLISTATVAADGSINVSMTMSQDLQNALLSALGEGSTVDFALTALSNDGDYSIDTDAFSRLISNGKLKFAVV